eukprot:TRINITY_DN690_c0_g1_i2.p1 TRINITY_DN690_c0_g1~~TRINITY_DN690_c0_g1_i2.p1  ORF type:complete len:137 (+),score=18.34 TRINITY_DN690_c0_g1_i2:42-413(+)
MRLLSLVTILVIFLSINIIKCNHNDDPLSWKNCTVPNDCTFEVGYPYCRKGRCSQCAPKHFFKDCECKPGEYCISDPDDPYYAMCRSKNENGIFKTNCNENLRLKGMELILGANDTMFCGKVV